MHRHYQSHFHGIQNTLTSGNKIHIINKGLESAHQYRRHKRQHRFDPWVGKSPWRRKWQPTAIFLPGESRGWRSLAGCSPWGRRVGQDWATEHASLGSEAFSLHALLKTHKTSHVVMVVSSQLELKLESSVRAKALEMYIVNLILS